MTDNLLTIDEHKLVDTLGQAAQLFKKISGGEIKADDAEWCDKIHQLQQTVLAQAAARAYPTKYRLLGRTFTCGLSIGGVKCTLLTGHMGPHANPDIDCVHEPQDPLGGDPSCRHCGVEAYDC